MNDVYTVLLTYDKDDLIVDDVIDFALLGICSEEIAIILCKKKTYRKPIMSHG